MNETVQISKERYEELIDRELKLRCLENSGVDNWEWYDLAMEDYWEDKEDQ